MIEALSGGGARRRRERRSGLEGDDMVMIMYPPKMRGEAGGRPGRRTLRGRAFHLSLEGSRDGRSC